MTEERKRYKDTKYAEAEIIAHADTGVCAIAACGLSSRRSTFLTIRGRVEHAWFCDLHYIEEVDAENAYGIGL